MRDITVKVDELETKIRSNREAHRDKFLRAQEIFRARMIEELERRLEDARHGRDIDVYFNLPEPRDHTNDYDRVLEMLAMHIGETLELSERDVQTYVMDQWGWTAEFNTTNAVYAVE